MVSLQSVAEVGQHVKFLCAAIDRVQVSLDWAVDAVSTELAHHTEHRAFGISRQEDHQIQMSLLYLQSSVPSNGTVRCRAEDEEGKEQYMSKASPFFIMRGVSAATCDQVEVCDNETSSCREKPGGGVECVCRPGYTRDEHYTGFCLEARDVDEQCFIDLQCKAARTHSGCRRGLCRFNDSSSAGSGSASGPTRSLSAAAPSSSRPVVRDEEIVIVVLVLMVWVAVILLFFNKWGKIRMLEPYQPQYQREPQFSTSSSLGPPPVLLKTTGAVERELRRLSSVASNYYVGGVAATGASRLHRVRQNSVFVGSQILVAPLPRRYKSAEDIKSMVVQIEHQASTQSTAL
ncbi:unnamed protein product [Ixodes persulcatus]